MPFAELNEVVLRGVSQAVDCLECQRLLLDEELDPAGGQPASDALVKSDGVLLALVPNDPTSVQDRSLQQHLEGVVHEQKHGLRPSVVPGPVEVLDA